MEEFRTKYKANKYKAKYEQLKRSILQKGGNGKMVRVNGMKKYFLGDSYERSDLVGNFVYYTETKERSRPREKYTSVNMKYIAQIAIIIISPPIRTHIAYSTQPIILPSRYTGTCF